MTRILPQAEDYAIELFKSLDDEQKKVAYRKKSFDEPGENPKIAGKQVYKPRTKVPLVGKAVGLPAAKMTKEQKEMLTKLLASYTGRMPSDVAELEMKQVKDGGFENVHFAFTGTAELNKGFTYRVQGPTFVVEFLNIQNDSAGTPNNHIHSCWRRIKGDFGI